MGQHKSPVMAQCCHKSVRRHVGSWLCQLGSWLCQCKDAHWPKEAASSLHVTPGKWGCASRVQMAWGLRSVGEKCGVIVERSRGRPVLWETIWGGGGARICHLGQIITPIPSKVGCTWSTQSCASNLTGTAPVALLGLLCCCSG